MLGGWHGADLTHVRQCVELPVVDVAVAEVMRAKTAFLLGFEPVEWDGVGVARVEQFVAFGAPCSQPSGVPVAFLDGGVGGRDLCLVRPRCGLRGRWVVARVDRCRRVRCRRGRWVRPLAGRRSRWRRTEIDAATEHGTRHRHRRGLSAGPARARCAGAMRSALTRWAARGSGSSRPARRRRYRRRRNRRTG